MTAASTARRRLDLKARQRGDRLVRIASISCIIATLPRGVSLMVSVPRGFSMKRVIAPAIAIASGLADAICIAAVADVVDDQRAARGLAR